MLSRDYFRIEKAIHFIQQNAQQQPTLDRIAAHVHLSPHHFHRLFVEYAGVTPKQFLQLITTESAKRALENSNVFDASNESGLSSAGRLHDHFIKIEAVTPGEYKSGGAGLQIRYAFANSKFGDIFLCWTERGIHKLSFIETPSAFQQELKQIKSDWPKAEFIEDLTQARTLADEIFSQATTKELRIWAKGTAFQISVWRALLSIREGNISTYSKIAEWIQKPSASRAVGNAIGNNPIAYLIPCHRVIQKSGALGGYRWSPVRKSIMLACEFSKTIEL